MKKITLALFAIVCSTGSMISQNYVVQAPLYDGSSTRISGPSGHNTQKYQRSVFLVTQTELTLMSLTDNTVTAFGFDMRFGALTAAAGNFTLYLENTSDVTYNKGLDYTVAITGMQQCYAGAMTIPASTGGTVMGVSLTNDFIYTGDGIYVAYEWVANGPSPGEQSGAWMLANSSDLNPGGATVEGNALPAVSTMTNSDFRPTFRFTAGNIATNEVAVVSMEALGIVPKLSNAPNIVTAEIKNESTVALTNIPVTLDVTGANPFNDVQTISSLAAGATTVVSFAPYNPTNNGASTLSVSIPADENNFNNSYAWTQSVTCSDLANNPAVPASTFSQNALGFNTGGSGIISSKYTALATASLNAIRLAVGNTTINIQKQAYGVLMDATGNILATSNTLTINGANLGAFVNFNFDTPPVLTGGTEYYMGIGIPAGPMFPIGTAVFDPYVNVKKYYVSTLAAGSVPNLTNRGYMGIQAVLGFSNTTVSASASHSLICSGDTITLTVTGGPDTYTWSPGNLQGSTVVLTPTLAASAGTNNINFNYSVIGTDGPSGCRSAATVISFSVNRCEEVPPPDGTGLAENSFAGYNINLYPNPSINGKTSISGLVGTNAITVYNTLGQVVVRQVVSDEIITIDLSDKPAGNYLVKITNPYNESRMIKLVHVNQD